MLSQFDIVHGLSQVVKPIKAPFSLKSVEHARTSLPTTCVLTVINCVNRIKNPSNLLDNKVGTNDNLSSS